MKVRELREALEALACTQARGKVADKALRTFFTSVARHDAMSIESFLRTFRRAEEGRAAPAASERSMTGVTPAPSSAAIVLQLETAFADDAAFGRAIADIAGDKRVTKQVLTDVFHGLFRRSAGVPSKASRSEILRLIEDERLILVRNEKMGALLGRRVVAAE